MSFKETTRIAIFFIIGSVIGRAGNFIFKFLAAYYTSAAEYSEFAIFSRTVQLIIPFFGFELHSPLTRRIRINEANVIPSFVWSYRITAVFGITCFTALVYLTLPYLSFPLYLVTIISLILWGMAEFGVGIARGRDLIKEASIFASLSGLFRFAFVSVFLVLSNLNSETASYSWVLSMALVAFYILMAIGSDWKLLFKISSPDWSKIYRNLAESVRVFLAALGQQGGIYVTSLVAYSVLTDENYRIFDMALIGVSIVAIITSNLSLSILQQFSAKSEITFKQSTLRYFRLIMILIIIAVIIIYFLVVIFSPDIYLLNLLGWGYTFSTLQDIRLFIFLPPLMVTASISHGLLQAVGRYNAIAIFNILSLILVGISCLIAYIYSIIYLIPIALMIGKLIQSIAYPQRLITS